MGVSDWNGSAPVSMVVVGVTMWAEVKTVPSLVMPMTAWDGSDRHRPEENPRATERDCCVCVESLRERP